MKMITRDWCLLAVLSAAIIAAPALAQDAMQGMDMTHTHHQAKDTAASTAVKKPQHAKKQAQAQKLPTQSLHHMDMSSMPNMTTPPHQHQASGVTHTQHVNSMTGRNMGKPHEPYVPLQPPPKLTGEVKVLDIGAQIGVRPLMRGLNLQPMQMHMPGMQMQGGQAPPHARSADYSDGIGYGPMPGMDMMDDTALGMLLIDRLEGFNGRDASGIALDAVGWYGTDANKLWLEAEGEAESGHLRNVRFEALWNHAVSTYWDAQLGVRQDFGIGPSRTWAAFGIQGLAPYWFDVEANFYVGQAGRTALRFETEYELMLTQRLILQPHIELNLYGRDDPQRRIGAGLSDAELGLRLRYKVTRKFAPYIGVAFARSFGKTADYARSAGEDAFTPRLVAGLRLWF